MIVSQVNGKRVICCKSQDGGLRVLDACGVTACDVMLTDSDNHASLEEKLAPLFIRPVDPKREPPITLFIEVSLESLRLNVVRHSLGVLSGLFDSGSSVHITFHFVDDLADWDEVCALLRELRSNLSNSHRVVIRLSGPFGEITDQSMDDLYGLGIGLRYTVGFPVSRTAESVPVNNTVVNRLAEFGFRVPITMYVHSANIHVIESFINEMLTLSYYSGFSLPLASSSIFYSFQNGDPPLPDAGKYCELLVRAYKQHSNFDDDLTPLNELAALAKRGGWNRAADLPAIVKLYLDSGGAVKVYRQLPSESICWKESDDLCSASAAELRKDLQRFFRDTFSWSKNLFCGDCCWRDVCGGVDQFTGASIRTQDALATLCNHRMLFLEHFALGRTPDVTVGT